MFFRCSHPKLSQGHLARVILSLVNFCLRWFLKKVQGRKAVVQIAYRYFKELTWPVIIVAAGATEWGIFDVMYPGPVCPASKYIYNTEMGRIEPVYSHITVSRPGRLDDYIDEDVCAPLSPVLPALWKAADYLP
jgi:hypothetical protein